MKAVVHDRYGPPDVLRIEEVERPTPLRPSTGDRGRGVGFRAVDCYRQLVIHELEGGIEVLSLAPKFSARRLPT